jgi:putative spermidine/putrescine transport system permease protein
VGATFAGRGAGVNIGSVLRRGILGLLVLYLTVPIAVTLVYSFATNWSTLLPDGYTLGAWEKLFNDPIFWQSMGRSMIVAGAAVVLSIFFLVPTLFAITLYAPKLAGILEFFSLWPFVFPGVILAVGLIQIFSNPPLAISGTPWLLIPAVTVVVMPFAYRAVSNAFESISVRELAEAARSLGSSDAQILPSVLPGVLSGGVLTLSAAFGEFALAQLIVGSGWLTLPYYQYQANGQDGHRSAAISVLVFGIAWGLGALALQFGRGSRTVTAV